VNKSELKPVDIHEGLNNTLLLLHHRLRAEGNHPEIQVIKDYGQVPKVTCYASQLNQVFMNLLNNAIDALETQPPPRVITIRTSVIAKNRGQGRTDNPDIDQDSPWSSLSPQFVVIRIADNGPGISEVVRQKIFDPFFTTKPVGNGRGLGLSTSYQIVVEKHKGQLNYASALGQGAEFIVEIPIQQEFVKESCS
jgi:signal transduction histidine kinase